jgi:hypothetical protein
MELLRARMAGLTSVRVRFSVGAVWTSYHAGTIPFKGLGRVRTGFQRRLADDDIEEPEVDGL